MKKKLCPSMMCADFTELKQEVSQLDEAGVDMFHMDIMDGDFVPNMALGIEDYKAVRSLTKTPMDAHLMVQNPSNYVQMFKDAGANRLYIHPEADQIPTSTLKTIRDLGMEAGIAINPGTSVSSIEPLLNLVDAVLVMTVNPGFAGQKYLGFVNKKIDQLVSLGQEYKFEVFVDGAIAPDKVTMLSNKGVTGFVLGTSSLFGKDKSYKSLVEELREL